MIYGRQNKSSSLGLLGFGMTTVLLNIHNAGLYPLGPPNTCDGVSLWWISSSDRRNNGIQEM